MEYEQIVNPDLAAQGLIGYCEQFNERVWHAPKRVATASLAWQQAQFKHPGEEPPANVAVPIWWSYLSAGHTATNVPRVGVLSSPWQLNTTRAWLSSRTALERIYSDNGKYPLKYLGWSEDIAGVRVVKPKEVHDVINNDGGWRGRLNKTMQVCQGRDLTDQEFQRFVGKTLLEFLEWAEDSSATQDWQNKAINSDQYLSIAEQRGKLLTEIREVLGNVVSTDNETPDAVKSALASVPGSPLPTVLQPGLYKVK